MDTSDRHDLKHIIKKIYKLSLTQVTESTGARLSTHVRCRRRKREPHMQPMVDLACKNDKQQRIHLITLLYCSMRFSASVAASFLMATLASGRVYTTTGRENQRCEQTIFNFSYILTIFVFLVTFEYPVQ